VSAADRAASGRDEPLPPPWPVRSSGRLSLRQSTAAWIAGGLVGLVVAVALIAVMAGLV